MLKNTGQSTEKKDLTEWPASLPVDPRGSTLAVNGNQKEVILMLDTDRENRYTPCSHHEAYLVPHIIRPVGIQ